MKESSIHLPDSEIWYRLKQGDENAFAILMRRYFNDLHRYGCRFCNEQSIVEDCIQEMFVGIWVKRETLSEINFVKSYLFKSLRRRLIRNSRQDKNQSLNSLTDESPFALDLSPEDLLIQDQSSEYSNQRLLESLNKLPPRQKEAVYLRFFENLTYNDIAQVMSVSVAYLYELIHKGIQNLRRWFMVILNLSFLLLV